MLRLTLAWVFITIYTSAFILFTVLTLGIFTPWVLHLACRGWGKIVLKIAGIRLKVIDQQYLGAPGPRIIMYNHQSMLDVAWLAATFVERGVAIVKKEFIYIPFINIAFYLAGFIFIDRKKREDAIQKLSIATNRIIAKKASLYIAPEGTRSFNNQLQTFKKGGFHIALSGKLPIYPIIVHGAHELLPKGHFLPKKGILTLKCLPPIDTSAWQIEDLDSHIDAVRNIMQAEYASLAEM